MIIPTTPGSCAMVRDDVRESLEQSLTTDRINALLPTSHGDPIRGTEPGDHSCI